MFFSYTRWGWVTPFMCALFVLGGLVLGFRITGEPGWATLIGAAVLVVTCGLHYLLGLAANSTVTPEGRVWHDRSTVSGVPMQVMGIIVNLVFALLLVAIALGHWTTGAVGVLFFLVVAVGAAVFAVRGMRRAGTRKESA
jgi:hypothetical protein